MAWLTYFWRRAKVNCVEEILQKKGFRSGLAVVDSQQLLMMQLMITKDEDNYEVMRLIVGGGHAAKNSHEKGSVIVGVRTLSEGVRVGNFPREQIKSHLVKDTHKDIT